MASTAAALLAPKSGTAADRRFRKYGRVGRMPGVLGVAAALGIVCLAKRLLNGYGGLISFEYASRRALSSSGSSEIHACEGITLTDFDENGGVAVYFLCIVYVFLGVAHCCDVAL